MRAFRVLTLALTLLVSLASVSSAEDKSDMDGEASGTDSSLTAQVLVNGAPLQTGEPAIMEGDRLFVPLAPLAEQFAGKVEWNEETRTVTVQTAYHDHLAFVIGEPVLLLNEREYVMDVAPFIHNERTYIPLRHAAEFLHASVEWDAASQTATLESVPLYPIGEGESLAGVADKFGTTQQLLMERNGLTSTLLHPGFKLKVVVPEIMTEKLQLEDEEEERLEINEEDLLLLAKIIEIEAGHEPYEGQLAVGSVIMNRVESDRFPDTVREVIHQPGQFPPVHNGALEKTEPGELALKAAEAVLSGENNVEGALYFYNPKVTSGSFWKSRTLVKEIGSHRFVK